MSPSTPPFDLTDEILERVGEIESAIGRLSEDLPPERHLLLLRATTIRTVHWSCAVEGNTLTAEQVEAVLGGRLVRGPVRDIREVQNALDAYVRIEEWDPAARVDLKAAHGMLMAGLPATPQVTPQVKRVLAVCQGELSRAELQ